jgi:hypothetical protein
MATNGNSPRDESPAGSPRSASISLQAAATLNAGLQHESSRRSSSSSHALVRTSPHTGRRRSAVLMNLQLNDPSVPGPGEMASERLGSYQATSPLLLAHSPTTADPHHHRAPSLGELHQELEAEQEAHVNRLLQMIRQQQLELQRLHASNAANVPNTAVAPDGGSGLSERSSHGTPQHAASQGSLPSITPVGSYPRSPVLPHHRASMDQNRRSRTPSRGASPRLRSTSISAESSDLALGGRDESAFYQAETQMLTRENQMLRHRIRELGT